MRYDDASQAGSMASDSAPVARADVDALSPGSFGPENGNVITGAGTISGAGGADSVGDAPTSVVEVHGSGGPTSATGGSFQAVGQYGVLNMDAEGNFSYVRNPGTPEGVQDAFGYTIADKDGQTSSATLAMNVGPAAQTAAVTIPGVINLPPGVELSDIRVSGRDLIITLPDGSHMTIPGGAVFVPQLVIGDVQVPPSNLAALLIESEPQPAAGQLQSSGGNFATDVPPLDPGVPLGDLIPPTELVFQPPEFEEIGQFVDTEPTIDIQPEGQLASVAAVDEVFEAGLPARNGGEPEGSGEEAAAGANGDPSEATTGVIHFTAEDGLDSITINGVAITVVGQVIAGAQGTLTITSIDLAGGQIGYSYLLTDNTNPGGDGITDPFTVTVTDSDGDTATATLTINIHDDAPTARDDTDALGEDDTSTDGNVMTGVNTTSGTAGHDTVGADNATVTGAHPGTSGSFTAVPQDGSGVVIHGTFGDLTIHDDGSYTYALVGEQGAGGTEVFTYQLTDGDGDVDTATLTITVPADAVPQVGTPQNVIVDEDGLQNANVDSNPLQSDPGETDANEDASVSGQVVVNFGNDVPANLVASIELLDDPALDGQLTDLDGNPVTFALNGSGQLVGSANGVDVMIISIAGAVAGPGVGDVTYTYEVDLLQPVEHPDVGNNENSVFLNGVDFQVTDQDGDTATGSFNVEVVDDVPSADDIEVTQSSEDANVVIDITGSIVPGADGVDLADVTHSDPTGPGTLSYNSNTGVFTYDPDPGEEGDVTFTYTIVDGDGDQITKTVTIHLLADDVPDIGTPQNVTVDEDGLANANVDSNPLQSDPAETDSNEDASVSGQVVVGYGDDVPANLLASIELLDSDSYDGQLKDLGGNDVTFALNGSGQLVGSANGVDVITISITNAVAGPGAGEVTYTYEVELLQPVQHADSGNNENSDFLNGIQFQVTDSDGDQDTGSFNVTVVDDVPSLENVQGASSITFDETSEVSITGWPATGVTSAAAMITATSVFGADGAAASGATVYGLALLGGVDSLDSGLQTAQGDHAITLVLIDSDTVEGQYQSGGTQVAFTIQMNANGTVTYTQNVPLEHSDDGSTAIAHNDTNSPLDLDGLLFATIAITDGDGDTASAQTNIGDQITIFDDGPTAIDPDALVTENEAQSVITASLDVDDSVIENFGADGPGAITFANITDNQDSGLTSGGDAIHYFISDDGQTIEGKTGAASDGTGGTLIFTVHIDQANSEYEYTQFATIDNGAGVEFNDLSGGVAGNPPFKLITEPGVTTELLASPINGSSINSDTDDMGVDSQFIDTTAGADTGIRIDFGDFTYVPNAGGTADDQFTIDDNSNPINGFKFTIDQVSNGTTADVHLKAIDADDDGGAAENTPNPSGDVIDPITSIEIFDNLGASIGVFTGDAVVGGITIDFNAGEVNIDNLPSLYSIATFTADGYNRIEITNSGNDDSSDTDGKYSISHFSIETVNTGEPVNLNFDLQITDSDGDFVALPGAIDITLNVATADSLSLLSVGSGPESSFDTSSLFASNDNKGGDNNRAFNAGSNSVLVGALAAAGLASDPVAASSNDGGTDQNVSDSDTTTTSTFSVTSVSEDSSSSSSSDSQLVGDTHGSSEEAPEHGPQSNDNNGGGHDSSVSNEQSDAQAPSDLPQGTDAPTQDGGSTPVTAAAIIMPAAEDLAGKPDGQSAAGDNGQHNQVVGQVLADALHGGDTSSIDTLINSLPGHGDNGTAALEALASQGAAAVPNGDMGIFGGFSAGQGSHMMEQMAMHQDAAPAHA